MNVKECSAWCGATERTIRRWIKKYSIPHKKDISGNIHISNIDWNDFCIDKNIERVK